MQGKYCFILLLTLAVCWGNEVENVEVHEAATRFSMQMFQKILQQGSGNAICSPIGVYAVLAMLQHGAGGTTKQQLDQVIHANENITREGYHNLTKDYQRSERYNEIEFASRMFIKSDMDVRPQYKELLTNNFHASIDNVDFNDPPTATQHINNWVAESTHNHTTELFTPDKIDSGTVLVLVNAIFFKSFWDNRFLEAENEAFSPTPDEEIQVPTMQQRAYFQAGESSELGAKWVHLTFERVNDFTLLLVLPTERHGLDSLTQLTHEQWASIFSYQNYKNVNVSLPKFKLETETKLIPLLSSLGASALFGSGADFSGMTGSPMQISEFMQKAGVGVDELGVTASAATGVVFFRSGKYYEPNAEEMEFKADQPFLVFIIHRPHGVPLFAGRVTNPLLH